jgi:retinol-binding protein 3
VVDDVETNLKEYYIEPTVAQQMIDALKAHQTNGDYDAISDGDALAARLTTDLQAVSHDKHMRVDFSHFRMPSGTGPATEDEALFHQQMEHENCGFDKVEIIPDNIGYVKFDHFMDPSFCGPRWPQRWALLRIPMRSSSICGRTAAAKRRWLR